MMKIVYPTDSQDPTLGGLRSNLTRTIKILEERIKILEERINKIRSDKEPGIPKARKAPGRRKKKPVKTEVPKKEEKKE